MSYRKAEEILPRELIEVISAVRGRREYLYSEKAGASERAGVSVHRQDRSWMRATVPFAGSIERAKVSRDYPRNIILQKRVYSGLSVSIDNNKNEAAER